MMLYPSFTKYPQINYNYHKKDYENNNTNFYNDASSNIKTNNKQKQEIQKNFESPIFNVFGISLYFDDILLICLILFLLNENIDDDLLYIVLILLLVP